MSTTSLIGIEREDKSIDAVHCHWDGYPEHNGDLLLNYFNTPELIEELLSFGDISMLSDCIENCEFFCRDMKADLKRPKNFKSLTDVSKYWVNYFYIFSDNEWKCYGNAGQVIDLSPLRRIKT